MDRGTEEVTELRFVCPVCRSNSLWAFGLTGPLEIEHVYSNGVLSWGVFEPEEVFDYHCRACGYEIELDEEEGLMEW